MTHVTQADVEATTRDEWIRGTTRCLPPLQDIPKLFRQELYGPNLYSRMVDAWYTGTPIPVADVSLNPGFKDGQAIKRFIMAHLVSQEPLHEHKLSGCAYLLSQIMTLKE